MNAVIIEDEQDAIDGLRLSLKSFCPEVNVVGDASTIESAYNLIKSAKPDLVFLDIDLKNRSGFELITLFDNIEFLLIFTTAYEDYTLQALRVNAMDYLLKPLDPEELENAVKRCGEAIKKKRIPEYDKLYTIRSQSSFNKIGVPTSSGVTFVPVQDILRLESSNNYTYIHFRKGKPMLISRTLKVFEKLLPKEVFMRVHQSHIINSECIITFDRSNGTHLTLTGNHIIPVSKSMRQKVKQWITELYPMA